MNKKGLLGIIILAIVLLVVGFFWFTKNYEAPKESGEEESAKIANPASEYCVNQGHSSEIRETGDGQAGYCVSASGQECDEWDFYRGACSFDNSKYCVPSSCCHASSCVVSDLPLNCEEEICTMECQGGTMDCGAGLCAFVEGECEVVWNEQ